MLLYDFTPKVDFKLSAVAGHHSFFRAVKSWEFKTVSVNGLGSGMGKW